MARLAIMLRNQGENGRAFEWAAAAARQRTSDDRAGLDYAHGTILLRGLAGERNEARGLQLIRRSADAGFAQSQDVVGDCCVFEEPDIAFCWYMRAALQGSRRGVVDFHARSPLCSSSGLPDCQWLVGTMLGLGDGCKKDEVAATQWFRKAACQGDVDAMQEMFRVLFRTDLPCMSWGEGAYWLVRALLESMSGGVEPVVGDECLIALQERLALEPALCALHSGHRLRELYQYGAEERVAHLVSPAVLSVYCESRKRAQDAVLCFMLARRRPGLPALLLRDVALIITRLMLWPSRSDPEAWNVALVAP